MTAALALVLAATFFPTALGPTHYEDVGPESAPAVVLVHGVSGPMTVWDPTVGALEGTGYRVLRFDLYGRGASARPEGARYDLDDYVHQLEELIAGRKLVGPVALVGSSFGAIVATEFALRHPALVRGLVLVGPAGFPIEVPTLARLADVPVLGDLLFHTVGTRVILQQNRKYFASGEPPAAFWTGFVEQLEVPGTKEAMRATLREAPVQAFVESYRALGRTGLPVGVIWGRKDATFPYDFHTTLLGAVPQARLVTLDASAHLPMWEEPAATNEALLGFLKTFAARSTP